MLTDRSWYFDGSRFWMKTARFFNLLEPDRCVVSMTKVLLWGTTIQSIIVVNDADSLVQVAGALGLNMAAIVKHEVRRRSQKKESP